MRMCIVKRFGELKIITVVKRLLIGHSAKGGWVTLETGLAQCIINDRPKK